LAIEGDPGVTARLTSVAAVTVSATEGEVTLPTWAVMLAVPVATLVARPSELIVATPVVSECHVADVVKS